MKTSARLLPLVAAVLALTETGSGASEAINKTRRKDPDLLHGSPGGSLDDRMKTQISKANADAKAIKKGRKKSKKFKK